ncbi:MAG: transcription-repair coupling factor [Clostridia bacterium]|nr:transcription-repair coupling factor [Clostridia bacterium]
MMNRLKAKIDEIERFNQVTISGMNEGEKTFLPCFFHGKMMIVAKDFEMLEKYENMISSYGKRVISIYKKIPLLITFNDRQNADYKRLLKVVDALSKEDFDVLLVTPDALFQRLPRKEFVLGKNLTLKKGKSYNPREIIKKLMSMGYSKQDIVAESGDFAFRGDILDVFAINAENPVRISFFDDEIDSINYFDIITFHSKKVCSELEIPSFSFLNIFDEEKKEITQKIRQDVAKLNLSPESMVQLMSVVNKQLELFDENISNVSNVFFLPFFEGFGATVFDYLCKEVRIIFDEPKLILDEIKQIEDENATNFLNLSLKGEFLPKNMEFYSTKKEILSGFSGGYPLVAFSRLLSQNKIFNSDNVVNFECGHTSKYFSRLLELTQDMKGFLSDGYTVIISCKNIALKNKIKTFFIEKSIETFEAKNFEEIRTGKINLLTIDIFYSLHFELEKIVIVGIFDLLAHQSLKNEKKGIEGRNFLPEVGQYVVHEVHGIGKCVEIKSIKITDVYRDYIVIEYLNKDRLYVPSENSDLLSLYSGEVTPKLNKIGGAEFYKIKQKVKSSLKKMAFDLLKVYGQRLNAKGYVYSKDTYLQSAFESAFPFPYTDDQVQALREIKKDMESSRVMDRLLCGDVGFGKTEVALAAAFKAIQDGKQVAFICPTTILCEQHFATTASRMKNFLVEVGVINRFKSNSEQKEILSNLLDGKIDIICGTHRLLSDDVKFKNLGLIIVDEEQRFGVEDKEKLKNKKLTVDVLSLSATPIPRTLYMSLSGIRDVSFLSTAPKDRKKIATAVIDYSDNILVDACKKELAREGQVLVVYNRVETIGNFYAHLKSLLPEAKIGLAHGQMNTKTLESAIYDLYSRKTQILISTVLIENGIDLPYANTLFVIDADKLGLSQLYQLRGRIGRSGIEAYSYFSFSKNKILSTDAYKRLDAIMEFSDFGSGYKLALRDLEIRGAGDVLGRSQSGHMQQVGFDLYVKLLNEAVKELRGEKVNEVREIKLDLSLSAYVPQDYISTNEQRILFYTKVSKIHFQKELTDLLNETASKFGPIPQPTVQLCKVGFIKNLGQKVLIKHIVLNEFETTITFYEDILKKPLYKFLSSPSVDFVLKSDKSPIISLKKEQNKEKQEESLISFLIYCQKFE